MVTAYLAHWVTTRREGERCRVYRVRAKRLQVMVTLLGDIELADLDEPMLKLADDELAEQGLAIKTIKDYIGDTQRAMNWAAGEGLIDAAVAHRVGLYKGAKVGRGGRPSRKREPVSDDDFHAVLRHVDPLIGAALLLLWHCGARPNELMQLRLCDLEDDGVVLRFRPPQHKAKSKGKDRVLLFGPEARAVLRHVTAGLDPEAYVFGRRRLRSGQYLRMMLTRKTPTSCGNGPGQKRVAPVGEADDRPIHPTVLNNAVARACHEAGVEPWEVYCLRHAACTRIARKHGAHVAQQMLGHASISMTSRYLHTSVDDAAAAIARGAA